METATTITWLDRLAEGGTDADWHRLWEDYAPLLKRWTARTGIQAFAQDDVVQEVLVVVVRKVNGFDNRGHGAFRAWLRGILAKQLAAHFRRASVHTELDLNAVADPASDLGRRWDREHDEHVIGRALRAVRGDFADRTWRAFHRQMIDGLNAKDVSVELGVSVNAVQLAKNRVLRRLRAELCGIAD